MKIHGSAAVLCAAVVVACSSDRPWGGSGQEGDSEPLAMLQPVAAQPASGALARAVGLAGSDIGLQNSLTGAGVGGLRSADGRLVAASPLARFDFEPSLDPRADGPVVLRLGADDRDAVVLTPSQAVPSMVELADGRAVYQGAWPSTDLVWLLQGRSLEQVLVLHSPEAPRAFAWRMQSGERFTVPANEAGEVTLGDTAGVQRMRVGRGMLIGADGARRPATVRWASGYLVVDATASAGMVHPVMVWSGIDVPAQQLQSTPPTQIKAQVMVLMDTSGSMGFYFKDPVKWPDDIPGGDGSFEYTDKTNTKAYLFPGRLQGNVRQGALSRLYAAKAAVRNAVNGYGGSVDFGLETFDFSLCGFNQPLCTQCGYAVQNGIVYTCLYANNTFTTWMGINWVSEGCTKGGKIVVAPGPGSGAKILPWVDGIEDHRSSGDNNNAYGTGSSPLNPEIRAMGNTPLAQAINVARTDWFSVAQPADPKKDCRPYSLIVMTDGVQSTGGTPPCDANPATAAGALYSAYPANPAKTYVIGVSITPADKAALNAIAVAGSTGAARFADDQTAIEQAFADIASASVKFETCNGADDTCNDMIDEGLGVYEECAANAQCGSNSCSVGRCTCSSDAQCAAGFLCGAGFCRPSCSVGQGKCLRTGVRKCATGATSCCVKDNLGTCLVLVPGASSVEVCNGIDDNCDGVIDEGGVCQTCTPVAEVCDGKDNDCDGVVDNNLIDTAKPCGLNVGVCTPGTTACVGGTLVCQGGVQPGTEVCNGLDDNCDGIIDGMKANCYTGPPNTQNVGLCVGGQWQCVAAAGSGIPTWGPCVGQILPVAEVCNGLDDNCNGQVDDVQGVNTACCPSNKCGVGACVAGTLQCSGGSLQCVGGKGPTVEICNLVDDDCNGIVDDVGGGQLGNTCCPSGKCDPPIGVCKAGILACGANGLECKGAVNPSAEICDNLDNDCNGTVDDVVGMGLECCPSGACGCTNCPCKKGVLQCTANGLECVGAVGAQVETCDGVDNNCNGVVDDVPGKGESCCPEGSPPGDAPGACSKGICKPGVKGCENGALACVGGNAPAVELCNGQDDDCDGQIDEQADVETNDPAVGQECQVPSAPNDQPPCKAGKTVCKGAKVVCEGAVQPKAEVCNNVDEDCNGLVDDNAPCPGEGKCIDGVCAQPCKAGEFPCPGGQKCVDNYCVNIVVDAGPDTGAGGSAGSQPDAAVPDAAAGKAGSAGAAGKGGSAGAGAAAGSPDSGAGGGAVSEPAPADEGGCGCRVPARTGPPAGWMLALLGLAAWACRRRGVK
jgi:hypothetical protein